MGDAVSHQPRPARKRRRLPDHELLLIKHVPETNGFDAETFPGSGSSYTRIIMDDAVVARLIRQTIFAASSTLKLDGGMSQSGTCFTQTTICNFVPPRGQKCRSVDGSGCVVRARNASGP